MDFFEAQDAARRKTAWLVVLFLGAVLSLIVLTNAAVGIAITVASEGQLTLSTLPPSLWVIISSGVLVIIFIGSAIQAFRLRAGGASVALTFGGRLVTEETTDPLARRAQNIVEEMALAAGIPVPPLYIIPEAGINAFAAGFGLKDAVIGLNQGTLEALNRDELQGVIAHEFSHIVNGDMGINIRLMALLHGILMISVAGRVLMHARGGGRQRNSAAQVVALGFALLVIGYSGVFFGRLIKASISRQREFLADAAAVQFTRNPQGIGDALRRIGGAQESSFITHDRAEESSHLFFGPIRHFSRLLGTHPPLEARIKAVLPAWDGAYLPPLALGATEAHAPEPAEDQGSAFAGPEAALALGALASEQVLRQVVGQANLTAATQRIAALPPGLRDALHHPETAWAVALGLRNGWEEAAGYALALGPAGQMAVLQLALPALRSQSTSALLAQDDELKALPPPPKSLPCWVADEALRQLFAGALQGPKRAPGRNHHFQEAEAELETLFRCLAAAGGGDGAQQRAAVQAGHRALELGNAAPDAPPGENFALPEDLTEADFDRAVAKLRDLSPKPLAQVLNAFVQVIDDDGALTEGEYALLQGLALLLDCPLPARFDGAPIPASRGVGDSSRSGE